VPINHLARDSELDADLTLTNVNFTGNTASVSNTDARGGGMYMGAGSNLSIPALGAGRG